MRTELTEQLERTLSTGARHLGRCIVRRFLSRSEPVPARAWKRRERRAPIGFVAMCSVLAGLFSASAQNAEDARLESFFRRHLDVSLRQRPVEATGLGDHRYDHLLDDISKEARAGWVEHARATLKELPRAVDYKKLARAGQVDFAILQQDLRRDIWLAENFQPFEKDPRTYGRYISDSVYVLLTQSTLPKETNIANCIARMKEIPRAIATAKQTLTRPPKQHLETAIRQNRGAIAFYEKEILELAAAASPSPLNGERAGVRGEGEREHPTSNMQRPTSNVAPQAHPSPSIPLPFEGRGKQLWLSQETSRRAGFAFGCTCCGGFTNPRHQFLPRLHPRGCGETHRPAPPHLAILRWRRTELCHDEGRPEVAR
jgi:hypothetical protein